MKRSQIVRNLCKVVGTDSNDERGLYRLQCIYESNVGESAMDFGPLRLISFLASHYEQYPQDIATDFPEWANETACNT